MALRSVPSIICASVVLAFAFAQPLGTGAISGTAVDGANGDPVRKAIVTLTLEGAPSRWATTRTDDSGRFQFQALPPGKYDLDATKTGIGTAIYGANHLHEFGNLITLRKGESRGGLKLHFMHPASISGHVYDSDGEPLSGVTMNLVRPSRNLGAPVLTLYRVSITDDRGVYRFPDIDAGRYYLRAVPPTRVRAPGFSVNQPILVDQYYGGVKDYKDATALHVGESDITRLDFHLNSEPSVDIHGRILGIPEQPEPPPSSGAHHVVTIDGLFVQVEISSADGLPQTHSGGPLPH
jgi:protocatechuate 3,4-dioxygenase beta subunit